MISVVICSVSEALLNNVKQNILSTIGVPCEILGYDNRKDRKGICEVYNRGAREAEYDLICYMHEDILIKTKDWGAKVVQLFNNHSDLGIIGVAGSTYKPLAPSGWGAPDIDNKITYQNFIQYYKNDTKQPEFKYANPTNDILSNVASVDGLWFCTKKKIVFEHPFDEELLRDFHCYDIDFCINVVRKYKIAVIFSILIEHFSEGGYDSKWLLETLKIHDKWRNYLPIHVSDITKEQMSLFEKRTFKHLFEMHAPNFSLPFFFMLIKKYRSAKILDNKALFKLHYYALKYKMKSIWG